MYSFRKIFFRAPVGEIESADDALADAHLVVRVGGGWRQFCVVPNCTIQILTRQTFALRVFGERTSKAVFAFSQHSVCHMCFGAWGVAFTVGLLMVLGLVRGHLIGVSCLLLGMPAHIDNILLCSWPLLSLLTREFEFWFLMSEMIVAFLGLAIAFGFDDRTWFLFMACASCVSLICGDACHRSLRVHTIRGNVLGSGEPLFDLFIVLPLI